MQPPCPFFIIMAVADKRFVFEVRHQRSLVAALLSTTPLPVGLGKSNRLSTHRFRTFDAVSDSQAVNRAVIPAPG